MCICPAQIQWFCIGRCRHTLKVCVCFFLSVVSCLTVFVCYLCESRNNRIYELSIMHIYFLCYALLMKSILEMNENTNKVKREKTHFFRAVLHVNRRDLKSPIRYNKNAVRIISTISLAFPIETIFRRLSLIRCASLSPSFTRYHYYSEELPLDIDQFGGFNRPFYFCSRLTPFRMHKLVKCIFLAKQVIWQSVKSLKTNKRNRKNSK